VENGDLNWIIPGKFLAFSGPHNKSRIENGMMIAGVLKLVYTNSVCLQILGFDPIIEQFVRVWYIIFYLHCQFSFGCRLL